MLAVGDSFVSLTNLDSVSKLNVFLRLFVCTASKCAAGRIKQLMYFDTMHFFT